jgi:hypothetical protein
MFLLNLLNELSQFGFILSTIYLIFVVINFFIKLWGRFKLGNETRFAMSTWEKSLLLIAITYILTFLI